MSKYVEDALIPLKLDLLCRIAQLKKEIKDIDDSNCDASECRHIMITTYHGMIGCMDAAIEAAGTIKMGDSTIVYRKSKDPLKSEYLNSGHERMCSTVISKEI